MSYGTSLLRWLLRVVIFFVPGCHPVLFQVFPIVISRLYSVLFPLDGDGAVTGNLIFTVGSLEIAKLQRERKERRL